MVERAGIEGVEAGMEVVMDARVEEGLGARLRTGRGGD